MTTAPGRPRGAVTGHRTVEVAGSPVHVLEWPEPGPPC